MAEKKLPVTLQTIQDAQKRIAPYIRKTPLIPFDFLSYKTGKEVLLKCEMLQNTGSFKLRGATHCVLQNLEQAKQKGVVAASAGNHAQGVAFICKQLGIQATIVMPSVTPPIKVMNTQQWGAKVELVGNVYDESFEHATRLSKDHGYLFVPPFKDTHVISGQGTIGLELIEDPRFQEVEAVVIAIGGGGLMTGCATALKALKPGIKIYGATAKNAPSLWKSFQTRSVTPESVQLTLADGIATKKADGQMLAGILELVDEVFSLSEESIAHAISLLAERAKIVVEGAGAIPIAAILENLIPEKKLAVVLSGGNIDLPSLSRVLERGLAEQGRLTRLSISVVDRPGSLHGITEVLAKNQANILQVFHQRSMMHTALGDTVIDIELESRSNDHTQQIIQALTQKGFRVHRVC